MHNQTTPFYLVKGLKPIHAGWPIPTAVLCRSILGVASGYHHSHWDSFPLGDCSSVNCLPPSFSSPCVIREWWLHSRPRGDAVVGVVLDSSASWRRNRSPKSSLCSCEWPSRSALIKAASPRCKTFSLGRLILRRSRGSTAASTSTEGSEGRAQHRQLSP